MLKVMDFKKNDDGVEVFVLKMMDFMLKVMDFILKMSSSPRWTPRREALQVPRAIRTTPRVF